jgi:hypothetical protein
MSKDKSILEDIENIENAAKSMVKKVEEVLDEVAADEKPHIVTYDDADKQPAPDTPERK